MNHRRFRLPLALLTLLLLGGAWAQQADFSFDPGLWLSDPRFAVAAIVAFVAWLRKVFPKIDGPIAVPALALAVGALGGVAGQLADILTALPYANLAFPWGGLLYGLVCAGTAVLGVNLVELVGGKLGKAVIGIFTKGDDVAAASSTATDAARARLRR